MSRQRQSARAREREAFARAYERAHRIPKGVESREVLELARGLYDDRLQHFKFWRACRVFERAEARHSATDPRGRWKS